MPVPYIPIPSLQGTALNMPTPSAAALAAPSAALGQVARGLADMGGALGQHASKVQDLENAYQESEVRQRISADMAELNQQLANNSDPASYMPLLEKSLAKQKTYLDDQSLSPVVKEKLAFHFEQISSDARLHTGAAAAGMTAKRAQLAINNELEAAATYGNREAYTDAVTRGVDAGIILPEQADTLHTNFEQRATYDFIVKSIEKDPIMVAAQLNDEKTITQLFPNLTPENHERLKKYAEQQSNRAKAESWEQIKVSSMEGAVLSQEDISKMLHDGDITAAQAGSYLSAYHSGAALKFDPVLFDNAHNSILTYDPKQDPTGAERAQISALLATLPLPKESIDELSKQFKRQSSPGEKDLPNQNLQAEYSKRLETEWNSEAFGNWFDYDTTDFKTSAGEQKSFTKRVIAQKDFATSLAFKTKTRDAFNTWLSQQPEGVDPLEAEKKYNEIKGKALDGISMPDLAPTLAPLPQFDDDQLTNPDGSPSLLPPPTATDPKTSKIGTFGGQPIKRAGMFYKGAATSVFGGNTDPQDNGLSANGDSNNAFPGVAIPEKMLKATFPGKSKQWFFDNVKIVVEADNGRKVTLPLADYGTAEWVTEREKNHKLDLNPKAVAALGGTIIYKDGKMKAHTGFTNVNFALTTAKAGKLDPKTSSIEDMKAEWFKDKRPRHPDQIDSGLSALYEEFYRNQLPADA